LNRFDLNRNRPNHEPSHLSYTYLHSIFHWTFHGSQTSRSRKKNSG